VDFNERFVLLQPEGTVGAGTPSRGSGNGATPVTGVGLTVVPAVLVPPTTLIAEALRVVFPFAASAVEEFESTATPQSLVVRLTCPIRFIALAAEELSDTTQFVGMTLTAAATAVAATFNERSPPTAPKVKGFC
jgi:hypothetical protein